MKKQEKIIFISDFDGTITKKDFYWILLDDYIGEKGIDYYKEWKKRKKIGTEFLNTVFTWYEFTEDERIEALNKVEIDKGVTQVRDYIQQIGGEFLILSAGFKYYIDYALDKYGIEQMKVITNNGDFRNNTFIMEPDNNSIYYSEIYGIDKEKVAKEYRNKCKLLIYAGDSEPDYKAALYADIIFAKNELADMLDNNNINYYKYESFIDIYEKLRGSLNLKWDSNND